MPEPTTPDRPPAERAGEPSDAPEAHAPDEPGDDEPGDGGEQTTTCAVCGKERPAGWQCGCGDNPGPMVPEGWDPALTRGTGPRLPLVGKQGGRAG
jgi:hypothetical protein